MCSYKQYGSMITLYNFKWCQYLSTHFHRCALNSSQLNIKLTCIPFDQNNSMKLCDVWLFTGTFVNHEYPRTVWLILIKYSRTCKQTMKSWWRPTYKLCNVLCSEWYCYHYDHHLSYVFNNIGIHLHTFKYLSSIISDTDW